MGEPTVLYRKEGRIAVITLNRPQVRNAFDRAMAAAMDAAVDRAAQEDDVWVAVVAAAGPSFCAGVDLHALAEPDRESAASIRAPIERHGHAGWSAYRLFTLEKPTIAAVRGHAFGGGLGIALACDIRIAGEDAQFSAIFTRRGLAPDSGTSFSLIQAVGYSRACELAFTARTVAAAEAERIGLVNRVVPPGQVEREAMAIAEETVRGAPVALRMAKRGLRRGLEREALAAFEYELYVNNVCARTEDMVEGGRAFLEKRPPRWKGI